MGTYYDTTTGAIKVGWYKSASTPTLESNVTIVKTGPGGLYDVVVDAKSIQTEYSTEVNGNNVTG